jgi:hypothetical protein
MLNRKYFPVFFCVSYFENLVSPHIDKLPRTLWNTMVNIQKANEQGFIAVLHVAHYSEFVCTLTNTCTTLFCQPGQHAVFISWYILHLEFTLYQFSTKKFITVNSDTGFSVTYLDEDSPNFQNKNLHIGGAHQNLK